MILKICVLLSIFGVPRSLTPPRILYGGWTPIMPGHPFYFGPVSRKNVEALHQQSDLGHPADDSFHQSPLHNVEHHSEEHLEFITPQQLNQYKEQRQPRQYNQYTDQQQLQEDNQYTDQQQPQQYKQYTDHQQLQQYNQYTDQQQLQHHNQYTDQQQPQQYNQYTDQQQLQHDNQYTDQQQPQQYNQYTDQQQPQQYNQYTDQQPQQYNQYTDQKQLQQFNQYTDQRQTYQVPHPAQSPIEDQQVTYVGSDKEVYPQHRDRTPVIGSPGVIQQIPLVHKPNEDAYGTYLQEHIKYDAPRNQYQGHTQHIPRARVPQKNVHLHSPPQGRYGGSNVPAVGHGQLYSSDQKSGKNIFSYYPHQSIYDEPPKIQLKPVYFENAGTPGNYLEHPHKHLPYDVASLVKSLGPLNLNPLDHGGDQKSYLKVTPLGHVDPRALKQLGQIALRGIEYPIKNYPLITDSSGGAPKYPGSSTNSHLAYSNNNSPSLKLSPGNGGGTETYGFRHNSQLPLEYKSSTNLKSESPQHFRRPFNPIETKSYSSEKEAMKLIKKDVPGIHKYRVISISPGVTNSPVYPVSAYNGFSLNYRYPPKTVLTRPLGGSKNLLTPPINLQNQRKKYTAPRILPYGSVRPYYSRTILPVSYMSLPRSRTLAHLPLRTAPGNYYPKSLPSFANNVKLQTIYQGPTIVAKSEGSPAISAAHVPVPPTQAGYTSSYPNGKDYIYYTAATTESTQVAEADKFNRSVFNYETARDPQHPTTYADPASDVDGSISHDNSVDNAPYHHEYRYIFVSNGGVRTEKDEDVRTTDPEKQFFHAYYAPADHAAPPGYVKMTIREFDNLFKNAEIRYVDKDPAAGGQEVSTRSQTAS